jgi:hypothetical protein
MANSNTLIIDSEHEINSIYNNRSDIPIYMIDPPRILERSPNRTGFSARPSRVKI